MLLCFERGAFANRVCRKKHQWPPRHAVDCRLEAIHDDVGVAMPEIMMASSVLGLIPPQSWPVDVQRQSERQELGHCIITLPPMSWQLSDPWQIVGARLRIAAKCGLTSGGQKQHLSDESA